MKKLYFLFLFFILNTTLFAQDDDILISAEIMPSFQSCEPLLGSADHQYCNKKTFLEYMYDNIKYPAAARENNIQGGLQVEFVIDKNGKLQEPKVTIGLGSGCDEEVLRVLKLMENEPEMWIAGENEGKSVSVRVWQFIFFKIPPNGAEMSSIKNQLIPEVTSIFLPNAKKNRTVGKKDEITNDKKDKEIFTIVEKMPVFPGCESLETEEEKKKCTEVKLLKYMYENLTYPSAARENGVEGLVVAQFVVTADGSISGLKIIKGIGSGCDIAVVEILNTFNEKNMKWQPGQQKGEAVPVRYNLPIRFKLAANE